MWSIRTLFSKGIVFLSLTNARLTAWTLLLSRAFLLATRWAGFSQCGTCLYELFFFPDDDDDFFQDFSPLEEDFPSLFAFEVRLLLMFFLPVFDFFVAIGLIEDVVLT